MMGQGKSEIPLVKRAMIRSMQETTTTVGRRRSQTSMIPSNMFKKMI